jgi:hypothetical protein
MRPVLRLISELALVGAWYGYNGGKAYKPIQAEDLGPNFVLERINYLVRLSPAGMLFIVRLNLSKLFRCQMILNTAIFRCS